MQTSSSKLTTSSSDFSSQSNSKFETINPAPPLAKIIPFSEILGSFASIAFLGDMAFKMGRLLSIIFVSNSLTAQQAFGLVLLLVSSGDFYQCFGFFQHQKIDDPDPCLIQKITAEHDPAVHIAGLRKST
ncbi:MAG: hypothetical protein JNM42_04215 [Propionivibrio sp.]|uniref:hypothetical protein n=1 Tax=Propionivibrio sp. TaxID=2212460 RepID=UPI001A520CEE|nr:hypothetical protein [Propionivibrio sp.]MBL8413626.1 hypothetical protein [Propionivibrio sp.]